MAFERCCICTTFTSAIHWHHTIPRALGGEDSIQIPLCGDCHTTLHSKADAHFAFIKNGKKRPMVKYWSKFEDEERAEPWFKVLLASMLDPPVQTEDKLVLLPSIKVDMNLKAAIDVLKLDLKGQGITNLSQVIEFCIKNTLKQKGIPHDKKDPSNRHYKQNENSKNSDRFSKVW